MRIELDSESKVNFCCVFQKLLLILSYRIGAIGELSANTLACALTSTLTLIINKLKANTTAWMMFNYNLMLMMIKYDDG